MRIKIQQVSTSIFKNKSENYLIHEDNINLLTEEKIKQNLWAINNNIFIEDRLSSISNVQ